MGAVYAGEHVDLHKRVAVKVLHGLAAQSPEFRLRFEREARAASRLAHPGAFRSSTMAAWPESSQQKGPTSFSRCRISSWSWSRESDLLADRIERGKLPPQEAVVIARGVLAALRHAHGLELVHRDVKPAHIMLASVGDTAVLVKLLDFGLAKSLAADAADMKQPLTEVGLVFGTPDYISPEQAAGRPAGARSDLYALGVVLFETVCGVPPFMRTDAVDIVREHLLTPPPSPRRGTPTLSRKLEAVILKALEKDAEKRFQSAEEFMAALARCPEATGPTVATPPATQGASSQKPGGLAAARDRAALCRLAA
jgi:serine/threonine-protein kinase